MTEQARSIIDELRADRDFAKNLDEASNFVPPGYRPLAAGRDELGGKELRRLLILGKLTACIWHRDGTFKELTKKFWLSDKAEGAIVLGHTGLYRILLAEEGIGTEAPNEVLQADKTFVSPYIQRMLQASREFDLGSPKGRLVKKETLVTWFLEKGLPDGTAVSRNQAESMASLCRHPDAMRGGLRRGDWDKTPNPL